MAHPITTDIKELLEIQQNAYRDATTILFKSMNDRIESQNQMIYELRRSLEFSQDEIKDIKLELANSKIENRNCQTMINEQSLNINNLQEIVARMEDYSRKKNIRVDGIMEENNENWQQTQVKVQKVIEQKINVATVKVDYAHRLKNRNDQRGPRTIIAQLTHATDRDIILKNSHKLKGTNIYINEDLSDITMKKRKEKLQEMKDARNLGKIAYFVRDKLVVRDRLPEKSVKKPNEQLFTPPRRVSSLVNIFTPTTTPPKSNAVTPNSAMRRRPSPEVVTSPPAQNTRSSHQSKIKS